MDYLEACNCKAACPCIFVSTPTEGDCTAVLGWHTIKGIFLGAADLAGFPQARCTLRNGGLSSGRLRRHVPDVDGDDGCHNAAVRPSVRLCVRGRTPQAASSKSPLCPRRCVSRGILRDVDAFSAIAALLQQAFHRASLLSAMMAATSSMFARFDRGRRYQWTPFKDTCLRHCRSR
jgi:hypothetical protein